MDRALAVKDVNIMSYEIRYETKSGGSGLQKVQTNEAAKLALIKKHKERLTARVEINGITIGEVYKSNGHWNWYIDSEA
jgi:hypothetical protein